MNLTRKLDILVVDDDACTREYLRVLLSKKYQVHLATTTKEALRKVQQQDMDLVLLDILLENGENGLSFLKELKTINETTDVIIISGVNMIETIVQAMRLGATDYIHKPLEESTITLSIDRVIEQRNLKSSNTRLKQAVEESNHAPTIIGDSPAIKQVKTIISRLRGHHANVFLVGDTGTGKEMFARLVHYQEQDNGRPFVSINCAAIPENLLESMLFGHEKGSFTGATQRRIGKFELADGGDIFLDEISCLGHDLQAKLLRVLETKEVERVGGSTAKKVSFRVIAASNDNILQMVADGTFRKDLFYRLNTVTIELPPLNQRREDILPLANHFLELCKRSPQAKTLSPEVGDFLAKHDWRGNVRELKNTIENMIIFSQGETIEASDIAMLPSQNPINLTAGRELAGEANGSSNGHSNGATNDQPHYEQWTDAIPRHLSYHEIIMDVERTLITRSLEKHRWNKSKACKEMGLKRNKLYRKLTELGIGL